MYYKIDFFLICFDYIKVLLSMLVDIDICMKEICNDCVDKFKCYFKLFVILFFCGLFDLFSNVFVFWFYCIVFI